VPPGLGIPVCRLAVPFWASELLFHEPLRNLNQSSGLESNESQFYISPFGTRFVWEFKLNVAVNKIKINSFLFIIFLFLSVNCF
jgi:hypothetical protein